MRYYTVNSDSGYVSVEYLKHFILKRQAIAFARKMAKDGLDTVCLRHNPRKRTQIIVAAFKGESA